MIEILIIVPYEELVLEYNKKIKDVKSDGINFNTTTHIVGTDIKGLEIVKNYDIVVARGMTSHTITRLYPEVYKVEINMTSVDVLEAVARVKSLNNKAKIGLVLPEISLCSSRAIREISELEIHSVEVTNEKELYERMEYLRSLNCTHYIGGLTVKEYCIEHKLQYTQIMAGPAAIDKSIKEAILASSIIDKERMRSSLLKALVDNTSNCLIVINSKEKVIAANQVASSFFAKENLVGLNINEFLHIPSLVFEGEIEIVQNVNGQNVLITHRPLVFDGKGDGIVITIQKVSEIYETEIKVRNKISQKGLVAKYNFDDIIAQGINMRQLIAKALRYSQVEGNVLITGETGTGKELFVQSMHNSSLRANGPFVAVNCAALSQQLLESELFGYTEGAFTGAAKGGKIGLFELAHGGTLFLDEIGEMPMPLQAKLLRVLQENQVRRVGGSSVVPIDVRVMSATNQNLPQLIKDGLFRMDLYYRINILSLHIPPLRERVNDITLLFRHFLRLNAEKMNIITPEVEYMANHVLQEYHWMGNIRELKNIAERVLILNGSKLITKGKLIEADLNPTVNHSSRKEVDIENYKNCSSRDLYDRYITSSMSLNDFARHINISRTTLWRKFKSLDDI